MRVFKPVLAGLLPLLLVAGPSRGLVDRIKSPEFRAKHRLELVQSIILTEEPNSGATVNGDAPSDQKEETTPR